uniref:Uncharacterized protein n=1 Tax=Magnetococcus massalia (strain MO-1) TaxID=451514 RepID=A0A1S7LQ95_MAGMO|nr:protein of unknown function [Candidatus Magnetococcus massalia]
MAEDTSNNSSVEAADTEEDQQNLDDMTVLQNVESVDLDAEQQVNEDGEKNKAEDLQSASSIHMGTQTMPDLGDVEEDEEEEGVESGGTDVDANEAQATAQQQQQAAFEEDDDDGGIDIAPPPAGVDSGAGFDFTAPAVEPEATDDDSDDDEAADEEIVETVVPDAAPAETAAAVEETEEEAEEEEEEEEEEEVVEEEAEPEIALADGISMEPEEAAGNEDGQIELNLNIAQEDGNESLSVSIANAPDGATIQSSSADAYMAENPDADYPISQSDNGDWVVPGDFVEGLTLTPPEDSNDDFTLDITATTTETSSGLSNSVNVEVPVEVTGVADGVELDAKDAAGVEDHAVTLDIQADLMDIDGSENITSIVIGGVPDTIQLSAGTDNGDGNWSLEVADLDGLQANLDDNVSGLFDLSVTVTTQDVSEQLDEDGNVVVDDSTTQTMDFTLTVDPDADEVIITEGYAAGDEDSWIDIHSSFSLQDLDGSENVSAVTIDSVPDGASLQVIDESGSVVEITVTEGVAEIPMDYVVDDGAGNYTIEGLQVMPPADSNANFELGVNVTTTDDNGQTTDTQLTSGSIAVEVASVADEADLSASAASGGEDAAAIALDISAAVTDTDGSESISSVVISDVPDSVQLSAGSDNGDGSWTLEVGDLEGLTANVDGDVSGLFGDDRHRPCAR